MTAPIQQQISHKPVGADPEVISEFLNRELVPVVRTARAHINTALYMATATVGDGVATVFDLANPFGTLDVMVSAYLLSTGADEAILVGRPDASTVRVTFSSPPAADDARVLVRA